MEFFKKIEELNKSGLGSCNVLYVKPHAVVPKHFHKKSIEIEYVLKGNSKTHKEGNIHIWQRGKEHELINDSDEELVVVALKIPPHSDKDMHYV